MFIFFFSFFYLVEFGQSTIYYNLQPSYIKRAEMLFMLYTIDYQRMTDCIKKALFF